MHDMRSIANMLASDDGGIDPGSVRVHRGGGHITALASDGGGRNRVIRVRYGDGTARAQQQQQQRGGRAAGAGGGGAPGDGNAELGQRVEGLRDEVERSLLEILVQMSYSRDFGPGPGNNIILQPEESFEELIHRFGLGNDNRGASQDVIDSYPVEVVRAEGEAEDGDSSESDYDDDESILGSHEEREAPESDDEESSHGSDEIDDMSELGTCGICLEDYKVGDLTKTLSCPHRFHKECIDKWLRIVASCPLCKVDAGMYKGPISRD